MSKIETAFGGMQAADQFTIIAYQQPLLRLQTATEEFPIYSGRDCEFRFAAASGVVVGQVEEPPASNIPEPAITVEQFCIAKHTETGTELPINTDTATIERQKVRIINPVFLFGDLDEGIGQLLANQPNTGLTIVSHPLIRATLRELEAAHQTNPRIARRAEVLYTLARTTLNNMWDASSLKS